MNVDGINRENVASHLQKYRLSLKQEEKRIIPDKGDERPTLHAEASSSLTLLPTTPSPHPPAQAQEPAPSSSLHPLAPQPQAPFAALDVSQLQVGRDADGQQLLQTPPDCFDVNNTATNLLLDPGIPMAPPIQQRFTPPPPPEATVATRRKLFKKQQEAGRDATARQPAAAASGYSAVLVGWNNAAAQALARAPPAAAVRSRPGPHMQASQAVSIASGERSVPMAQLGMAAEAGEGQGQAAAEIAAEEEEGQDAPAEPEAAEMAAGPEEGQGPAGEPGAAPAGCVSPPDSSIHGQYWKIDDAEVSWDFGFLWYPTAAKP
ncbi:hypothetical protein C2845_PM07G08030 [Panicum miliaceum]|uniref:Uncharacterized protein n=1 Tax=Panicum miliaceum TaxID=4540 RepID=A0A3L6SKY8_PANMI|nr:hypothetical protein C2845_PM07G08030 [Panicum miliaceum]